MAKPNYFTCTLGQASSQNLTNPSFTNINNLIDSLASSHPSSPAVGFPSPNAQDRTQSWDKKIFTFSDVLSGSRSIACYLNRQHAQRLQKSDTVALICPSTPKFLFTWLALMRLGHAVLLIAPQCQPAAIAHLCKSCGTSLLYYDEVYETQAHETAQVASEGDLNAVALPSDYEFEELQSGTTAAADLPSIEVEQSDVAYLHHTSGTSSGVPKPIAQSHRAGAGVLPCFRDSQKAATFTTTPLYHGGIADLFRAWTSAALIWLFPGKGVPITASNIVRCLDVAAHSSEIERTPPVCYFSSVPYVLQSMEADERGLQLLQGMDIVGVGGAALPAEVGDRLVSKGVNLISRFGSAECGFLMSSHREYGKDKEWQYLRSDQGGNLLQFEKQEDDLCELVIQQGWPHMAKRNRDDGSFATADLFAPHESIENAWRYHSRADSQLTLITGKKFDPAPLEGAIAASDLLEDVLIFGNGQPFPGALLFRSQSATAMADTELVDKLWPTIDRLNNESQDHARIPRKMLIAMPALEKPLEKSSKGTILRSAVESRFATVMDKAYVDLGSMNVGNKDVPDDRVEAFLTTLIETIVPKGTKLERDTDLFSYGVDSVAGIQVRYGLGQLLPSPSGAGTKVPLNIVEDCGTVERLAEYVIKQRHGEDFAGDDDDEIEHQLMLDLVERYSQFAAANVETSEDGGGNANGEVLDGIEDEGESQAEQDSDSIEGQKEVVLLTGVTGALGAHLLDLYASSSQVSKVYCLVRGANSRAAEERVSKALAQRDLRPLDQRKVIILQAQIGEPRLGLSDKQYRLLARRVSIILHVAWSVNFRMRLRSFEKENISSVTNLINLALTSPRPRPPRLGFCSSVASVLNYSGDSSVPEKIVDSPSAASALGYSRSKWVAEQICRKANEQTPLRGRVQVFRIGQLSGDSHRGVWNTSEAWPLMLSLVKVTRTLPDLGNEALDWLPVDIAALSIMQAIIAGGEQSSSGGLPDVLHILNNKGKPDWRQLLQWLHKREDFAIVSPPMWVAQLEQAQQSEQSQSQEAQQSEGPRPGHPGFKLLAHWKRAYGGAAAIDPDTRMVEHTKAQRQCFDMDKTRRAVPALRTVAEVDEDYFALIWRWIDSTM